MRALPPIPAITCAWCSERCDPSWSYCIMCGHESGKPRDECGCVICWPELLVEIEQPSDVDRLNAQLKITRQWSAPVEKELDPGQRVILCAGLEIEVDEQEHAYLIIDDLPIWRGDLGDLRELHVYRTAKTEELQIVAVNLKVVWSRTG